MREKLSNWLTSFRIRLIIASVLVTAISFGFLFLLLMDPVEHFIMKREEDNLKSAAITLGSTIRDPFKFSRADFVSDQKWTQRRAHDLTERIEARIRLLDTRGNVLADSAYPAEGTSWIRTRMQIKSLSKRAEVARAIHGQYETAIRRAEFDGMTNIYVALPIKRTDAKGQEHVAFVMYLNKPVDSVRDNLKEMRALLLYSLIASMLVSILVSILVSSNLSSGLRAATQVAQSLSNGKMDQRMRTVGRDEVGQLGMAFNQMADALQRQEQLRRSLLADVSHELRTPLTAISGCADTLADGALLEDPKASERFLHIILRESERLQRLVNDILDLSKLQAGVVGIPCNPIPLCPLIEEAVEIARMQGAPAGVAITYAGQCDVDAQALQVVGNEDRLAQALRNLLDNALHHTPAGNTIAVNVCTEAEWVVIHVSDEGQGIPREEVPWVFDRFYRAGKGAKPGGTGLGLAIVREIMHAHGGQVTVESTVGVGTTFSLHLLRVQAETVGML